MNDATTSVEVKIERAGIGAWTPAVNSGHSVWTYQVGPLEGGVAYTLKAKAIKAGKPDGTHEVSITTNLIRTEQEIENLVAERAQRDNAPSVLDSDNALGGMFD